MRHTNLFGKLLWLNKHHASELRQTGIDKAWISSHWSADSIVLQQCLVFLKMNFIALEIAYNFCFATALGDLENNFILLRIARGICIATMLCNLENEFHHTWNADGICIATNARCFMRWISSQRCVWTWKQSFHYSWNQTDGQHWDSSKAQTEFFFIRSARTLALSPKQSVTLKHNINAMITSWRKCTVETAEIQFYF